MYHQGQTQLRQEGFPDHQHQIITQADVKYEGQVSDLTVPVPPGPITPATLTALAQNYDHEHQQSYGYRTQAPHQLVNLRVIARGLPQHPRTPTCIQPINPNIQSNAAISPNIQPNAANTPGIQPDVANPPGVPPNDASTPDIQSNADAPGVQQPNAVNTPNIQPAGATQPSRPVYFGPTQGWANTPITTRPNLTNQTTPGPLLIEEYDSTTVVPPTWTATVDPANNIILQRR